MPSAFSVFAIRVRPSPSAQNSKIRNDGRLIGVHPTDDVQSTATLGDIDVVVPEHAATRDVERLGLAGHRIVGPLAGLFPLHLGREVRERQHDFIHSVVERALAVLEVEEHPDARVHDSLERIGRLDRLAPQSAARQPTSTRAGRIGDPPRMARATDTGGADIDIRSRQASARRGD